MSQPRSGLRAVKRDFSTNSLVTDASEPSIPWSSSPPHSQARAPPTKTTDTAKKLSGYEARMKAIQAALDENIASSERVLSRSVVPNSSSEASSSQPRSVSSQKRDKPESDATQPPAKRRQLPETWSKPAVEPKAAFKRSSRPAVTGGSKKATGKPAPVFLSQEQTKILKLVQDGESVFYTGSAGTGKSVLLREIIKTMRKTHAKSPDAIAITASTGMAACNIGGVTIHSFAGIGLGIESAEDLTTKIRKNKKASARWLRTKVLIIDEVSMVEADLFDKLCRIGSLMRKNPKPFGGIQIIVTGDFFQLPPVVKRGETKFAFEAGLWGEAVSRTFNLTQVFRQRDQTFVNMLNEMRFGRLSPASIAKFKSLSRPIKYDDGIEATELFPRREEVERSNQMRLRGLKTESHTYFSTDGGAITDQQQREKMLANFMAPGQLVLCVDSQVMLIRNNESNGLVNGSLGRVVAFSTEDNYLGESPDEPDSKAKEKGAAKKGAAVSTVVWPIIEFIMPGGYTKTEMIQPETFKVELPNGEVQCSRTQLPLILAWAMSIHKSQGQTLERVKVDLGKVFEKGQAYVALSRCTSLETLQILGFDSSKVQAHPKVVAWSKTLETLNEAEDMDDF